MDLTEQELQEILQSLDSGQWADARIMTFNDEYRLHHVLVATHTGSGKLYYYEADSGEFEPLGI